MKLGYKAFGFLVIFLFLFVMLTAGCSPGEDVADDAPVDTDDEVDPAETVEMNLTIAHQWPEGDNKAQAMQLFADIIEEETDGSITFTIYPADSLVTQQQMYEAIQAGTTDIGFVGSSFVAEQIREMAVFEIPGSFVPSDLLDVAEEIKPLLIDIHSQHNLRYLFQFHDDYSALASTIPVTEPEDLEGLRVREFGPLVGDAFEQWGAIPMTIPPPDLTTSMERGTTDAAIGGWVFIRAFRVYEQAPHITWLGFQTMWTYLMMNEDTWDQLTPEQQEIFDRAGMEAARFNFEMVEEDREQFQAYIEEEGGTNIFFSEEDTAALFEKVKPVYDDFRENTTPLGVELLEALEARW